jgi:hypothetical protein
MDFMRLECTLKRYSTNEWGRVLSVGRSPQEWQRWGASEGPGVVRCVVTRVQPKHHWQQTRRRANPLVREQSTWWGGTQQRRRGFCGRSLTGGAGSHDRLFGKKSTGWGEDPLWFKLCAGRARGLEKSHRLGRRLWFSLCPLLGRSHQCTGDPDGQS